MLSKLLTLFILFSTNCFAQSLFICVQDKKSGEPIPNATITLLFQKNDHNLTLKSNLKGVSIFDSLPSLKTEVLIHHELYNPFKKNIEFKNNADSIVYQFYLEPIKLKNLNVVNLKSKTKVDTVFGVKNESVFDFEVIGVDSLIILTYNKYKSKANKIIISSKGEEIRSLLLPEYIENLVQDYKGNIHALSKNNSYCLRIFNDSILATTISKDYYIKYLAPIVDTTTSKSILTNFSDVYPAFEYYVMDKIDSTYKILTNIKDEWMMELYRSEYKWVDVRTKLWAKQKEIDSGIDAEIWVGANYFTRSIYWKEVYAPMFAKNDTIYVFNYPKDRLEIYNDDGDSISFVDIFHHYHQNKTGFQRNLIQDGKTGVIYCTYLKNGNCFISPIDSKTGKVGDLYALSNRYVEKIKVFNNNVYYIYRPFESMQKKFLYSEKLPYKYRQSKVNRDYLISIDTGK